MKKILLSVAVLIATTFAVFAENDKPITAEQLPATAQKFIGKYFADTKVSFAKMESELMDKNYDVVFANGNKVEFDSKGEWTEVDCINKQVPAELVPQKIQNFVSQNYAAANITKISRDKREYDIKLNNGIELEFNSKYKLKEIDL